MELTLEQFSNSVAWNCHPCDIEKYNEIWQFTKISKLLKKHIPTKEILIFTGEGVSVSYKAHHDCDCEHCEHYELITRNFEDEKEAQKLYSKLENDDEVYCLTIDFERFYIKAVKQLPLEGGLFNG